MGHVRTHSKRGILSLPYYLYSVFHGDHVYEVCLQSTLHEHICTNMLQDEHVLEGSLWRGLNVDGGSGQGWVEWWRWIKSAFWIDTHPSSISHLSLFKSILVCILSKSSKWSTRDRWLVNIGQYANAQMGPYRLRLSPPLILSALAWNTAK